MPAIINNNNNKWKNKYAPYFIQNMYKWKQKCQCQMISANGFVIHMIIFFLHIFVNGIICFLKVFHLLCLVNNNSVCPNEEKLGLLKRLKQINFSLFVNI